MQAHGVARRCLSLVEAAGKAERPYRVAEVRRPVLGRKRFDVKDDLPCLLVNSLALPKKSREIILDVKPFPSQDRKSTRLNSSHVRISYAVFCFKKKRQKHREGRPLEPA